MGGKRLDTFRQGDRTEYWVLTGLSKLAFIVPIPRQEDMGVMDFHCVLAEKIGICDYPKNPFNLQVKSAPEDLELDNDQIKWISNHMDCPLLLCICNKKEQTFTIYSCLRIWSVLFYRGNPSRIILCLDEDGPSPFHYEHTPYVNGLDDIEGEFKLYLGAPIIKVTLAQLEDDPTTALQVLSKWIELDKMNIARRSLGRVASLQYAAWKTNELPPEPPQILYYHRDVTNKDYTEEVATATSLMSLAMSYRRMRHEAKLSATCQILTLLSEHLDEGEKRLVNTQFAEMFPDRPQALPSTCEASSSPKVIDLTSE